MRLDLTSNWRSDLGRAALTFVMTAFGAALAAPLAVGIAFGVFYLFTNRAMSPTVAAHIFTGAVGGGAMMTITRTVEAFQGKR